MTVKAKVLRTPPKEGQSADLGDFDFIALPNAGDFIDIFQRTKGGGEMTPYEVVVVRHHVEAGKPSEVIILVE